jgi:hypothetical protein
MANAAPRHILEIKHKNPAAPAGFEKDGAATIAYGHPKPTFKVGGHFPSLDAKQEWKQVLLPPEEDYEVELAGASGWMLNPEFSKSDVPFDHPFGFDWECMVAVDHPPDGAAEPPADTPATDYTPLLARGNQVPEEDDQVINRARGLQIPIPHGYDKAPSLLGVEIDGGLVPKTFSDNVAEGDRIAVFGRWIVDCGHAVKVQVPTSQDDTFRSEIHPPLVMASAKVTTGSIMTGTPVGSEVTRVLFTSRPFLVGQKFSTDTDKVYDDTAGDDGPFVQHMLNEVGKVNNTFAGIPLSSTMVEAHPKIKSHPFRGPYLAHFVVRAPSLSQSAHGGHHHLNVGDFGPLSKSLTLSYQFTVRSGCAVQLISSGPDTVDVLIALNHVGYTSPPLPEKNSRTWSTDELSKLDPSAAAYTDVAWISAAYQGLIPNANPIGSVVVAKILGRGIKTDEYDTEPLTNVNILEAHHAAAASANNITAGQGVVQDDNQPYPVYGWLELAWTSPENR